MANIVRIIEKKRDGVVLTKDEIQYYITSIVDGSIQDSQLGAMLMAIYQNGMTSNETALLTKSMIETGSEVFRWPEEWAHLVVDKHSTGGVGDKVSLALVPALASCGLKIPMISGRGLGLTGGTLDKLESIPGFNVSLDIESIQQIVSDIGCCIVGQTEFLVPADKITYAVRDVTGTVGSEPLIAASIISKKASESLKSLIMDIKVGQGAEFKNNDDARNMANILVELCDSLRIGIVAKITRMESVLGRSAGHSLEVLEALDCLRPTSGRPLANNNNVEKDSCRVLRTLISELGAELLMQTGKAKTPSEAKEKLLLVMSNGEALQRFADMAKAQGVQSEIASKLIKSRKDAEDVFKHSEFKLSLHSDKTGFVENVNAEVVARLVSAIGGSRKKTGDFIDFSVGLQLFVDVGDTIKSGDVYGELHYNSMGLSAIDELKSCILEVSATPIPHDIINSLIIDTIKSADF